MPLLNQIQTSGGVFTPNGAGVTDAFPFAYALLKLTQPVAAQLGIYDLGGRRIRQLAVGRVSSGSRSHVWDGRDEGRRRVLPGLYIWRLRLAADAGAVERQGVVGVAY